MPNDTHSKTILAILTENSGHTYLGFLHPDGKGEKFYHFVGSHTPNHRVIELHEPITHEGRRHRMAIMPYTENNIDLFSKAVLVPVEDKVAERVRDFMEQLTLDYGHCFSEVARSRTGLPISARNQEDLRPYYFSTGLGGRGVRPLPAHERKGIPALDFHGAPREDTEIDPENFRRPAEDHPTAAMNCFRSTMHLLRDIGAVDITAITANAAYASEPKTFYEALEKKNSTKDLRVEDDDLDITINKRHVGQHPPAHAYEISLENTKDSLSLRKTLALIEEKTGKNLLSEIALEPALPPYGLGYAISL